MDIGAQSRFGTITIFNNSGAALTRGDVVGIDPDDWSSIAQADAIQTAPYESPMAAILPGVQLLHTGVHKVLGGVCLTDIADDQPGIICCFGVCLAKCAETATDASGTAYGAGTVPGQLDEITAATATTPCIAIQGGTSGTTTTGDLRLVFVHMLWGMNNEQSLESNPLGGT